MLKAKYSSEEAGACWSELEEHAMPNLARKACTSNSCLLWSEKYGAVGAAQVCWSKEQQARETEADPWPLWHIQSMPQGSFSGRELSDAVLHMSVSMWSSSSAILLELSCVARPAGLECKPDKHRDGLEIRMELEHGT